MKKQGFTLAEVLITLGIVGVVAALTAPALVMSSRNEANAARLSTVVSNMENAFQTAIAQEGVDNLYGTSLWEENRVDATAGNKARFVGRLGQYMILNGYKDNQAAFYGDGVRTYAMSNSGGVGQERNIGPLRTPFVIETKNGAAIFIAAQRNAFNPGTKNRAIDNGCTLYTQAAQVAIDVNGKNGPNVFGRDIFFFVLGENGVLYPYGGRDVNAVNGSIDGTWDQANTVFSCTDASKGNTPAVMGVGCTARVIAEGYKINY